jgi:hypothetical protein
MMIMMKLQHHPGNASIEVDVEVDFDMDDDVNVHIDDGIDRQHMNNPIATNLAIFNTCKIIPLDIKCFQKTKIPKCTLVWASKNNIAVRMGIKNSLCCTNGLK